MNLWYRVFAVNGAQPEPEALLDHLSGMGLHAAAHFYGDDQGWLRAELLCAEAHDPILLERYLVTEEGIRAELSVWAAWVEAAGDGPTHTRLMQHLISTTQVFTLRCPDDPVRQPVLGPYCAEVCRFLARQLDGVYQADGQGFFAAGGALLVPEESGPPAR